MEFPTRSEGQAAPGGDLLGGQGSREAHNVGGQHEDRGVSRPELVSLFNIRLAGLPDEEMRAAKIAFSSLAHYENHKALLTRMLVPLYDIPLSFKAGYCWTFFEEKPHSPGPHKLKENVAKMTVWDRNARVWRFDYDEDILLEGILDQHISL